VATYGIFLASHLLYPASVYLVYAFLRLWKGCVICVTNTYCFLNRCLEESELHKMLPMQLSFHQDVSKYSSYRWLLHLWQYQV